MAGRSGLCRVVQGKEVEAHRLQGPLLVGYTRAQMYSRFGRMIEKGRKETKKMEKWHRLWGTWNTPPVMKRKTASFGGEFSLHWMHCIVLLFLYGRSTYISSIVYRITGGMLKHRVSGNSSIATCLSNFLFFLCMSVGWWVGLEEKLCGYVTHSCRCLIFLVSSFLKNYW